MLAATACATGGGPRGTAAPTSSVTTTAPAASLTTAAPAPSSITPGETGLVVYVSGDIAGAKNVAVSQQLAQQVPLPSEGLQLFVYLGDVYPGGSAEAFASYDSVWGGTGRDVRAKTAALIGNLDTSARDTGWIPYWTGKLAPTWPGSLTQTDPPYYAVELGSWKFIMLDTNQDLQAGSSQYGFLVGELQEPGFRCIVCGHEPRWSSGQHGDNDELADAWKAMCDYGAVAYLSGHDHGSQIQPLRNAAGKAAAEGESARGVMQIVAGAGGDTLYRFVSGTGHSAATWGDDTHFALLRLTLQSDSLACEFLAAGGTLLHAAVFSLPPLSS
jgi:acid phosphatase type 7